MSAPSWTERRLSGLRRFAAAITLLNVWGHVWLGFEQAWIVPFVSVGTAYGMELLLESIDAWSRGRQPRFLGRWPAAVNFLLPPHISGLAVGMLLYAGEQLWVIAFASACAIGSKWILRAATGAAASGATRPTRHFMNPSNAGISLTLLLFPWVTPAPPYQFVANLDSLWDWLLPSIVIVSGSLLNLRLTGRFPLSAAWLVGFVVQAVVRAAINGTPVAAGLAPVTGLGFFLYTFYMVTDPGSTPEGRQSQMVFGAAVAAMYGVMMQWHEVFAFYYALTAVSLVRGAWLLVTARALAAVRPAPAIAAKPFGAAESS